MSAVTRITVSVSDLRIALDLYEGALGLKRLYELENIVMLSTTETAIEVQLHERPPAASDAGVAISFGVEDVDLVTATAIVSGATLVKPPENQPWGERQSVLRDADGHVFCLVSPLPEESPELL